MKGLETESPPQYMAPPLMKHPSSAPIQAISQSSSRTKNFTNDVSYQEFFRNMLLNSSLNGVSKIGMSQNYVRSLVWTVVLITGIVGCVYQSLEFFRAYKQYPAVVQLEVQTERTLEFPAVTVCNLNTVRKTAFFCKLMPYLVKRKLCEEMNITVMNPRDLSRIQSIYDLEENVTISHFYLPAPYSDNCSDSVILNPADSRQKGGYTEERCRENCRQKTIREKCGCALPFFQKDPGTENCVFSTKYQAFDTCIKNVEPRCDCQRPCYKVHYSTTISSSNWPGGELNDYYRKIGFQNMEEARGNMTRLKVYYQTLDHLIYKNNPKYEPNEILSVLGGFTGLWLGVSLVALFECLENFVTTVSFFSKRQLVHRRLQNVQPVTNKVDKIRY
ncbi:amiloride-sensitive sodium channel subunit alpha-like [Limulus polyphemus]|uniref:Amiloride-sensitive sodium channel subunit alpha-like n=1 Tax=Limulus polyphemus TaxID=6850 RepID=A0ABM1T839_LIMPO|nr:amiloride-sensitive sodium channel subunit alpha-like [Limulus polyphemus]